MVTKEIAGYLVEAAVAERHVDFNVYNSSSYGCMDGKLRFFGYIKWDGCSNWHIPGDDYQLHFCEVEDAVNFGTLFNKLYEWAAELLPGNEIRAVD